MKSGNSGTESGTRRWWFSPHPMLPTKKKKLGPPTAPPHLSPQTDLEGGNRAGWLWGGGGVLGAPPHAMAGTAAQWPSQEGKTSSVPGHKESVQSSRGTFRSAHDGAVDFPREIRKRGPEPSLSDLKRKAPNKLRVCKGELSEIGLQRRSPKRGDRLLGGHGLKGTELTIKTWSDLFYNPLCTRAHGAPHPVVGRSFHLHAPGF